jgi:hypothetical protein
MAFQQASNKGTLVQGQTISVNKYTVQVERYLSQGLVVELSFSDFVTIMNRRFCPCLPRQDPYARVWYNTPCP